MKKMIFEWMPRFRNVVADRFPSSVFFSKASLLVSGLIFGHSFLEHLVTGYLISYLNDKKTNEKLRSTAATVNVQETISAFLTIVLAYISDAYIGGFLVTVVSIALYIIGLLIMWLFDEPQSPENGLRLFYISAALIAVGKAGRIPTLKAFLADQLLEQEERLEPQSRANICWMAAWFFGALLPPLLDDLEWSKRFRISAILMMTVYALFLLGTKTYHGKRPAGSPLAAVPQVVKAALLRHRVRYHRATQIFGNDSDELEVRIILRTVPILSVFIAYSMVVATGNTFFYVQIKALNKQFGIDDTALCAIRSFSGLIALLLFESFIPRLWNSIDTRGNHFIQVRIGAGMFSSILCCLAAYLVERCRLHLSDEGTKISSLWLVPQFFLVGLMKGCAQDGLESFLCSQDSKILRTYAPAFYDAAFGIGSFLTFLAILAFETWVGDNINTSNLDSFYGMLGIACICNLLYYVFVAKFFYKNESEIKYKKYRGTELVERPLISSQVTFPSGTQYPLRLNWRVWMRSRSSVQ